MSLSMRVFQQRKLLSEFEEKHKLARLCSSQSNLDGDDSSAQGQEMREVVKTVTHTLSLSLSSSLFPFPHASKFINVMDLPIFHVIIIMWKRSDDLPSLDFIRSSRGRIIQ